MKILSTTSRDGLPDAPLPSQFRRPIATIGVFDGVHLGHQHVLMRVIAWARRVGGDGVVVTFADHPDSLLKGEAPPLLTPLALRLRLFERLGVDASVVLPFD